MQADHQVAIPKSLQVLASLAQLLERLERTPQGLDAGQYRSVVQHITLELSNLPSEPMLQSLLSAFPATAELYENLRYEQAGLCLHPLETSLATESKARDALRKAAHASA